MCDIKLEDVGGISCEPVSGLVSGEIKICPVADFETIGEIPKLDAVVSNDGLLATISVQHVMKSGKGFTNIEGITETAGIKSTPLGEKGRGLFQNELTVEAAGSDANMLAFGRKTKNLKAIVLFREFESDNWRQIGSKNLPASVKFEHTVEPTVEGKNSAIITITDKSVCPAPIYAGDVTSLLKPVDSE